MISRGRGNGAPLPIGRARGFAQKLRSFAPDAGDQHLRQAGARALLVDHEGGKRRLERGRFGRAVVADDRDGFARAVTGSAQGADDTGGQQVGGADDRSRCGVTGQQVLRGGGAGLRGGAAGDLERGIVAQSGGRQPGA